jgi:transposase InsO family protein
MRLFGFDRNMRRLASQPPPHLSPAAKARLRILDWHFAHQANVSRTARHFDLARSTVYRWLERYDNRRLESLETRSCRPHRRRQPTWTLEQAKAVLELRNQYPSWGKQKLVVLLRRQGLQLSESMVGRILVQQRRRGLLRQPPRLARTRRRRLVRHYGRRKPNEYVPIQPGDLGQLDTLDVSLATGPRFKHFSLIDVVSRYGLAELRSTASATTAKDSLERMLERAPFPFRAIQVDGGSEFMAEFEDFCQQRGIHLFVLPPRSPKLNGCVERFQRTHQDDFYSCADEAYNLATLRTQIPDWESVYNTVRPHQSLGQLTPLEFLGAHYPQLLGSVGSAV